MQLTAVICAAPHMGSAYTTIAVDTTARFQRMAGKRVTSVTGTDEHGEKIALSAAAKGVSPQEHCDKVAAEFAKLWQMVRLWKTCANNLACQIVVPHSVVMKVITSDALAAPSFLTATRHSCPASCGNMRIESSIHQATASIMDILPAWEILTSFTRVISPLLPAAQHQQRCVRAHHRPSAQGSGDTISAARQRYWRHLQGHI